MGVSGSGRERHPSGVIQTLKSTGNADFLLLHPCGTKRQVLTIRLSWSFELSSKHRIVISARVQLVLFPCLWSFSPQGCSTLFTESHGKDGFETAERCGVGVLGDRIGLVDPQDIVGEAAHSREDAGIFSDARRVFT